MKITSVNNNQYRQSFGMMPMLAPINKVPEVVPAIIEKVQVQKYVPAKMALWARLPMEKVNYKPLRLPEAIVSDTEIKIAKAAKELKDGKIKGKIKGPGRQIVENTPTVNVTYNLKIGHENHVPTVLTESY